MAIFRICLAVLLIIFPAFEGAGSPEPSVPPVLFDRPIMTVDPGMHTAPIWTAAADLQGRWAVAGSGDKKVKVWSLADGALVRTLNLPSGLGNIGKVWAVAISSDGALIAAGGWTSLTWANREEQIYLFDRATGTLVRRIEHLSAAVNRLAFSPDGARLAALFFNDGLRVYARQNDWGEAARDEDYHDRGYGADFASDGRLATTSYDGKIRLYTANLSGIIRPIQVVGAPSGDRPWGIAFSPDGMRLAVGYDDTAQVDLLDANTLTAGPSPGLGGISNGSLSHVAWSRRCHSVRGRQTPVER